MFIVVLFYISLPILFTIHDLEEIFTQRKWMQEHGPDLVERFPKLKTIVEHLSKLSTGAFAIAALEELIIILIVTFEEMECMGVIRCNVLNFPYAIFLYFALYFAFTVHLLVHVIQGCVVRGYVPGLTSAAVMLPVSSLFLLFVTSFDGTPNLFWWGVGGLIFMVLNLLFAHWLGIKICRLWAK